MFIVLNILSVVLFSYYLYYTDRAHRIENLEDTLDKIVVEKAQRISLTMQHIGNEAENLANWTEEYIVAAYDKEQLSDAYAFTEKGVLYRKASKEMPYKNYVKNSSSVFYPANQPFNQNVESLVMKTERLDPLFKRIFENNPYLTWVAIPMGNGFLRIYPYTKMDMFEANHMQSGDPFYIASTKNNPSNKTIWSEPYLDLMGSGWVLTCTHPITLNEKNVGVACLDVSLKTMQEDFLKDFRLGYSGFAYMLDESGNVIYHPLVEPKSKERGEIFKRNVIDDTNFSDNYKKAIKKVIKRKKGIVRYKEGVDTIAMAYSKVEGVPWKIVVEINQDEFISSKKFHGSTLAILVFYSIFVMAFFFLFLRKHYSKPLINLVNRAKEISKGNYEEGNERFVYNEMAELSLAFNNMSRSIRNNTSRLIEKNLEIETILNGIGGLLMIIDSRYRIVTVNANGADCFDINQSSCIGKRCYEIIARNEVPCSGCKVADVIKNMGHKTATVSMENRIFDVSWYPITDDKNCLKEIVVYNQDITEKVLLERELFQKEKLAGIGQMSSSIAHELKTPLSTIKGSLYLLEQYNKADSKIGKQLKIMKETIKDTENIVYNLLDYSRISRAETVKIDVEKTINQIIMISRQESNRINVTISVHFAHSPFIIFSKLEPFKQILVNVFSNALTALRTGGKLKIEGSIIKKHSKNYMKLCVKDNGPGIDESIKDRLFTPFVTSPDNENGSGLGLWITKLLIEKINGEIKIESETGLGTKVIIYLPSEEEKNET